MINIAELFLSEISIVDHAYIDDKGNVVGGSYNPTFFVAGNVDPVEQVVVDFSTIKKDIKHIIDEHNNGFDHKLWVIQGYSNYINIDYAALDVSSDATSVTIVTPSTILVMPLDALKVINVLDYPEITPGHTLAYIGNAFTMQVQDELRVKYGDSIQVHCVNTVTPHLPMQTVRAEFSYVHGLKDSTSYGCQNINHGHLSFIQCLPKSSIAFPAACEVTHLIATAVNNAIFINKTNILSETDEIISIGYTTVRGYFEATYKKKEYLIIVLDTETTVEHLVDYIAERFSAELESANIQTLFVSEGLSKGAMKRFV